MYTVKAGVLRLGGSRLSYFAGDGGRFCGSRLNFPI